MNDVQFWQTKMGRQHYEVSVPELTRQIHRLSDLLGLLIESIDRHAQSSVGAAKDKEARTP